MTCSTCTHGLARLSVDAVQTVLYCCRCGSLLIVRHGQAAGTPVVPELVARCRALVADVVRDRDFHPGAPNALRTFEQLGITEAILKPEERPT